MLPKRPRQLEDAYNKKRNAGQSAKKPIGILVRVFCGFFGILAQTIAVKQSLLRSNREESHMILKIPSIACIVQLLLLLACPFSAFADSDAERTSLAKIKHEIESLKPLIAEAKAQADSDARVQFQYDWLALDLDRMVLGIQEHLSAPSTQPRSFPPLKGDYRH